MFGKRRYEPDFSQLLKVLKQERPDRPVLFEFFMNPAVYAAFAGDRWTPGSDPAVDIAGRIGMLWAFYGAGYDYATVLPPAPFTFAPHLTDHSKTYSLNAGGGITDEASFVAFTWPDPDSQDYGYLDILADQLPEGMSLIVSGPGGVEENVIALTGYEQLCYMMADTPDLVTEIFREVGSRLDAYYRITAAHPAVGACISNDDWGFNTQTLLNVSQMEQWLFPWHQKIADTIHSSGKPALLHSCGNVYPVMDYITKKFKYDGKHSFEDSILPIEDAWDRYHHEIALLGGIDVNTLVLEPEDAIYRRSRAMLERSSAEGAYALGTGNSVPEYIPVEKYAAMLKAAWE